MLNRVDPAVQSCQKLLDAAKHARLPHEREAWLNLAFFLNEQYVEWHKDTGSLRVIPEETTGDRPRPVQNRITQYINQLQWEVNQDKPSGDVLPATGDYQDISDALVAKAYIDEQADPVNVNYNRVTSRATLWAWICGTSYEKWVWNPTLKRLDIMPVPFFEGYMDPYAKSFDKSRYFIHTQFMDVEQVYDQWGVDVKPDSVERADLTKTAMMRSMGSAPVLSGVTVNELWHKPSRRYKDGRYCVWAGNKLLHDGALPYSVLRRERKLPFTIVGALERPDSAYYLSPIKFLRAAQMELNQYHAQRIQLRKNFTNLKVFLPSELELDGDWDDSIAQVLRQTGGPPGIEPVILQPRVYIPNDDGDMLVKGMMDSVGQHEVSQAQVPGRVEAAKAIEMLLNQDANALSTMRECLSAANSEGWYLALEYAREFETAEKMVMAYTREGVPEVKQFRAGTLKPGFRIRTSMATGLAKGRAARQDQLIRLWELKIITDPKMMAELMDLPLPSVMADKAEDVRQARNENLEMAAGHAISPRSWDDHAEHLIQHNRYRKTAEWRALPEREKTLFEYHCTRHEDLLLVAAAKQAKLAMILQGGMPPGDDTAPEQDNESAPTGGPTQP